MASGQITSWQIDGETRSDFIFLSSKITADGYCSHEIKRGLLLGRRVMTNLDSIFKSRDITLPTKVRLVKAMVFPVVIWMWELDCEESWVLKNWWFWTVVLEKILESPLDCKEIQPVPSEGDQPWIFFGGNDAEAETPVLWPPHAKRWLIGKDSDAGRDWGQEKGTTEDEMAGWHHWFDGRESGWTPGVGNGQGGLVCCDSWGRRVGHDWVTDLIWSCFFDHPTDVGNLVSSASAFSKTNLNIWKFTVHVLLKPHLENFKHYLLTCEMSTIVQYFEHSLAFPFFGIGMKTDLF